MSGSLSLMTKSIQGLCHGRFAKTRFCFTYKNKELNLSLFLARPSLGSGSLFVNSLREPGVGFPFVMKFLSAETLLLPLLSFLQILLHHILEPGNLIRNKLLLVIGSHVHRPVEFIRGHLNNDETGQDNIVDLFIGPL